VSRRALQPFSRGSSRRSPPRVASSSRHVACRCTRLVGSGLSIRGEADSVALYEATE
jgi:hypothetical protein